MDKKKKKFLYAEPEAHAKILQIKKASGMSIQFIVNKALENFIKLNEHLIKK